MSQFKLGLIDRRAAVDDGLPKTLTTEYHAAQLARLAEDSTFKQPAVLVERTRQKRIALMIESLRGPGEGDDDDEVGGGGRQSGHSLPFAPRSSAAPSPSPFPSPSPHLLLCFCFFCMCVRQDEDSLGLGGEREREPRPAALPDVHSPPPGTSPSRGPGPRGGRGMKGPPGTATATATAAGTSNTPRPTSHRCLIP